MLHRALPVALARVQKQLVDTADGPAGSAAVGGADCYRVRVKQRNGQCAWISPFWVLA